MVYCVGLYGHGHRLLDGTRSNPSGHGSVRRAYTLVTYTITQLVSGGLKVLPHSEVDLALQTMRSEERSPYIVCVRATEELQTG